MKIKPMCINCIFSQVDRILKLYPEIDDKKAFSIYKKSLKYLSSINEFNETPAYYTTFIYRILRQEIAYDPFKKLKEKSIKATNKIRNLLYEKYIKQSLNPLENAIKLSAIGNIIDFGIKNVNLDILNIVKNDFSFNFKIYHIKEFIHLAKKSKLLVYFADNAGETIFDTFLIQELKNLNKNLKIIYIVKDKPVINDATIEDALKSNIDKYADLIISNGNDFVGTYIKACSKESLNYYNLADMIIAKGQGNFETLDEIKDKDIFFILKAKCDIIANYLNVAKNSLLLLYNKNF